ncbi:MAG: hypothetical protein KC613_01560 [Myxococcales bacterium]|nr:hypothetical protein [Myxococcales bacterium]
MAALWMLGLLLASPPAEAPEGNALRQVCAAVDAIVAARPEVLTPLAVVAVDRTDQRNTFAAEAVRHCLADLKHVLTLSPAQQRVMSNQLKQTFNGKNGPAVLAELDALARRAGARGTVMVWTKAGEGTTRVWASVVAGHAGVGRTPIVEIETDALGRLRRQFYDRKSRVTAVGLAVLPGGGHFYQDRIWLGAAIATVEATLIGLFTWQYLAARRSQDRYDDAETAAEAQALRTEGDEQYRNAQLLLGTLIGVHVLQMVHAGFLEPPAPDRARVFMSAGPAGAGVSVQWAF